MMLDITLKSLEAVKNLILSWRTEKRQLQSDKIEALNSVLRAATETRAYIANVRDGRKQIDPDKEIQLAELWQRASTSLIPIGNIDLADKCMVKADCWADPTLWQDERYSEIPLDLNTIVEECRDLLNPERSRTA